MFAHLYWIKRLVVLIETVFFEMGLHRSIGFHFNVFICPIRWNDWCHAGNGIYVDRWRSCTMSCSMKRKYTAFNQVTIIWYEISHPRDKKYFDALLRASALHADQIIWNSKCEISVAVCCVQSVTEIIISSGAHGNRYVAHRPPHILKGALTLCWWTWLMTICHDFHMSWGAVHYLQKH